MNDVRELLKDAAWSVDGSPELPQRARRRYVRARIRRATNGAVAVVAGVAVIAAVATIAPIGDDGSDVSDGQIVLIDQLQDAYFVDAVNAYAVERGADPQVARSTDGGASWRSLGRIETDDVAPLGREIVFLDRVHGLVWGGGALHTTADGGTTWSGTDGEFLAIGPSRADASVWALTGCAPDEPNCRPHVERSTDNGVTWRPTRSPALGTTEHQLIGISAQVAYVLDKSSSDSGANLWRTDDSGATWTSRKSPCIHAVMGRTSTPRVGMLWMRCEEVPGSAAQTAVVWRTFDDGVNWTPADGSGTELAPRQAKIADFKAVSEQIAVMVLDSGAIYSTVDGGTSWHHRFDLPAGSRAVLGVRAGTRVWAITTQDSPEHGLWMSADGVNWARVDRDETVEPTIVGQLPADVRQISFRDSMNGWLQNRDGYWYTVDRGRTWQPLATIPDSTRPAAIDVSFLADRRPTGATEVVGFSPVIAYATVPGDGVYATFDGGTTWSRKIEGTVTVVDVIPLVRTWVLVTGADGRQTLRQSGDGTDWTVVAETR